MALLRSLHTNTLVYIKPVHVFGRDPSASDIVLTHHSCSRMHGVIKWENGLWFLNDESRNGCIVNGEKLGKGKRICLEKGFHIVMAEAADHQWVVESLGEPKPVLIREDGSRFVELENNNILPNQEAPECQVVLQDQAWTLESGHELVPLKDGDSIKIAGALWRFHPNQLVEETRFHEPMAAAQPELEFFVSRNQEHVQLIFRDGNSSFDLGLKTHNYLLLEMARTYQADDGASEKDRGWMSNMLLLHNMNIDINHLNIQIYRAREAIRKCSAHWGQHLIERRRGEIRLHPSLIRIHDDSDMSSP